jgi:putative MATE family efflux protein
MENNRVGEFIKNPKKALLTLALPIAVAMLVQVMYNIVDTAFVGRLGAEAIAALTFSFPLIFMLISLESGIGAGINSGIARYLGSGNKNEAENTAIHGVLISLILALLVFVLGMFFLRPLFLLFGATENVLDLSVVFMSIILFGVFFMFPSYVLCTIFSSQGDTKTPMKIQISSLLCNAILDPIFIYLLGYGVAGAAIATLLSFILSLILSVYFIRRKSHLNISFKSFRFSFRIVKQIFSIGIPAMLMMLIISIYIMFINRFMSSFGTDHVASFGIVSRLETVATMPIIALSMALLTLVGMFYGAKRFDLLKEISGYSVKIAVLLTSIIGLIFFIMPTLFLRIFTPDKILLGISSAYLRIDVFTFPLMAVSAVISRAMHGMGYGLPGFIIQFVRIFVFAVPLAYLFVFILGYGYISIAVAMIIGGIASNIVALVWLEFELNKLNHNKA